MQCDRHMKCLCRNAVHTPVALLGSTHYLEPLRRQFRLANDPRRLKEHRCPRSACLNTFSGKFSLLLLQLLLDSCGLRVLPGMDGLGDTIPESERLIR
jgi:hypothetical protein